MYRLRNTAVPLEEVKEEGAPPKQEHCQKDATTRSVNLVEEVVVFEGENVTEVCSTKAYWMIGVCSR